MRLLHRASAACTIVSTCCGLCLLSLLRFLFHSDCFKDENLSQSSSVLQPLTAACLTAAAAALVCCSVFFLVMSESRSKRGWALFATICSRWQPLYFLITSAQRISLGALALFLALRSTSHHQDGCNASIGDQIAAAELVWNCVIFVAGMATISSDLDANFNPFLRRFAYCLFLFCLILDATGSFLWGPSISRVQFSVGRWQFFADNGMRSCIASQAVIAMHFVFVSYRSRNGRAWAYAPLRFILDDSGAACMQQQTNSFLKGFILDDSGENSLQDTLTSDKHGQASQNSGACVQLRQRFKRLQRRLLSQCRVFVVPCMASDDVKAGASPGVDIARPLFNMKCLRPLQRIAQAHPMLYLCSAFFVAVSSFAVVFVVPDNQIQGIVCLILNIAILVLIVGFVSSPRYNLDTVAVKCIASSFRFATFVVLLAMFIALESRRAYIGIRSPFQTLALTMVSIFFCMCTLLDCAPQFSAAFQIWISVTTCSHSQSSTLSLSHALCRLDG
jgi:hypothetical protein